MDHTLTTQQSIGQLAPSRPCDENFLFKENLHSCKSTREFDIIYLLMGNGSRHGGNKQMAIIRITRDVDFGGVVRIGEGALRVVTDADVATNAWGPDGARGKALFVPCNLADPDAGVVALDPDDYVVLPVLVGTVG